MTPLPKPDCPKLFIFRDLGRWFEGWNSAIDSFIGEFSRTYHFNVIYLLHQGHRGYNLSRSELNFYQQAKHIKKENKVAYEHVKFEMKYPPNVTWTD